MPGMGPAAPRRCGVRPSSRGPAPAAPPNPAGAGICCDSGLGAPLRLRHPRIQDGPVANFWRSRLVRHGGRLCHLRFAGDT